MKKIKITRASTAHKLPIYSIHEVFEAGDGYETALGGVFVSKDDCEVVDQGYTANWEERRYQILRVMMWRNLFSNDSKTAVGFFEKCLQDSNTAVTILRKTTLPDY